MRSKTLIAFSLASAVALTVMPASAQSTPSTAASAAAKASPELVGDLSKELGSTPEQAAGAAGALFGLAKTRLQPAEFTQVASAVPGMDSLLAAAPALDGAGAAMSQLGGSAKGLASMAGAFSKLGLSPAMVGKAVPVLTSFVSKSGGAGVGKLLGSVLK